MGTPIGSASVALSSLNAAGASRINRQAAPRVPEEEVANAVRRDQAPPVRVGFGENTLSPQGAALRTLDSNLEAAEAIVATVGELRERARVVQAEQAAEAPGPRPPERPEEARRLETLRPEADPAVRNFLPESPAAVSVTPPAAPAPPAADGAAPVRPAETAPAPNSSVPGNNVNRIDILA